MDVSPASQHARVVLLALGLSGCGFGLTPGAVPCGGVLGVDVYVDGVTNTRVPQTVVTNSDGTQTVLSYVTVPAMGCATALAEVQQAHDMGVAAGFWGADQSWSYRLEFLNTVELGEVGESAADGTSDSSFLVKDSAVAYGTDAEGLVPSSTYNAEVPHQSSVILTHEMLHWTYGEDSHCDWAARYAPAFGAWQNGRSSNFDDSCQHRSCSGAVCTADSQ